MLTLILLISSFVSFAHAGVSSVDADRCQQHCSLESRVDGHFYVSCSCEKKRGGIGARDLASLAATRKAFPAYNAPENIEQILACENERRRPRTDYSNAEEIKALASRAALPLCDCVDARVHLPVQRSCARQRTGEISCSFRPDLSRPSVKRALRRPTVEDYQSCLMAAANHKKPITCGGTSQCSATMPSCSEGEEIFNEADPEACCPVFVCRKVRA